MTRHPSELTWSLFLARHLGPFRRIGFWRHCHGCSRCLARAQDLIRERTAYEADARRNQELGALLQHAANTKPPEKARVSPWLVGLAVVPSAALIVWLIAVFVRPYSVAPQERDTLVSKGADSFVVALMLDGVTVPLPAQCSAGQKVKTHIATKHRYALVVNIGPDGSVQLLLC